MPTAFLSRVFLTRANFSSWFLNPLVVFPFLSKLYDGLAGFYTRKNGWGGELVLFSVLFSQGHYHGMAWSGR